MEKEFQFTVYSLKPLADVLRSTFQLPDYPFDEDVEPDGLRPETREFFLDHSIFHYRDEITKYAALVQPSDDDTPIYDWAGFRAYRTSGTLSWDEMKITEWDRGGDPVKYRKLLQRHGDGYAWTMWNKVVTITSVDEKAVSLI